MEELDEIVERFEKVVEDSKLSQKKTATKVEEKEYKRWRAEEHGEYYYLLDAGAGFEDGIGIAKSFDYRNDTDVSRYELGNYFKTEEEAEKRLEHIKIEQQLKDIVLRLNKGEKIDWEDEEQKKFHLWLFYGSLSYNSNILGKTQGVIYCLDENFKDIAIKEIGKERLINYLKES